MSPPRVSISNRQPRLTISAEEITRIVRVVLREHDIDSAEVSVVLVDHDEMRVLNQRHLDHDFTTDVLSFPLSSEGAPLEGEIVLCTGMAVDRAGEFGWSPDEELTLYLVHGLLHLLGYDDHAEADREAMRSGERNMLQALDITPPEPDRKPAQIPSTTDPAIGEG